MQKNIFDTNEEWKETHNTPWEDTDLSALRVSIAKHLLEKRTEKQLSTRELAKLSGVTDRQILRIEHSDPEHPKYDSKYNDVPSLTTVVKLANALHCSVLSLMWTYRFTLDQQKH